MAGGQVQLQLNSEQALRLWHDINLSLVRQRHAELSPRQSAILLTIYTQRPPHTVRALAAQLAVGKPVITRALDTLTILGLLTRRRDPRDRRNIFIERTVEGVVYLDRLADLVITAGVEDK